MLDSTRISLRELLVGLANKKNAAPINSVFIAKLSIGPRAGPWTPSVSTIVPPKGRPVLKIG